MKKIEVQRGQVCPVCGSEPRAKLIDVAWHDWLCICPNCGFSYRDLGDWGDSPEDALFLWDYNV